MQEKKNPSGPTQPENPVGAAMSDDPDDMNPERIGIQVVLPEGTRVFIANDITLAVTRSV